MTSKKPTKKPTKKLLSLNEMTPTTINALKHKAKRSKRHSLRQVALESSRCSPSSCSHLVTSQGATSYTLCSLWSSIPATNAPRLTAPAFKGNGTPAKRKLSVLRRAKPLINSYIGELTGRNKKASTTG